LVLRLAIFLSGSARDLRPAPVGASEAFQSMIAPGGTFKARGSCDQTEISGNFGLHGQLEIARAIVVWRWRSSNQGV
jgi:hypothetical protein